MRKLIITIAAAGLGLSAFGAAAQAQVPAQGFQTAVAQDGEAQFEQVRFGHRGFRGGFRGRGFRGGFRGRGFRGGFRGRGFRGGFRRGFVGRGFVGRGFGHRGFIGHGGFVGHKGFIGHGGFVGHKGFVGHGFGHKGFIGHGGFIGHKGFVGHGGFVGTNRFVTSRGFVTGSPVYNGRGVAVVTGPVAGGGVKAHDAFHGGAFQGVK